MGIFTKKTSSTDVQNNNENRSLMGNSGLSAQGDGNAISVNTTTVTTDGRAITEMGELARSVVTAERRKAMAAGANHKAIRAKELSTAQAVRAKELSTAQAVRTKELNTTNAMFEKALDFSRETTTKAVGAIAQFGRPDAGAGEVHSRNTMIFAAVVVVAFIAMMMFRRA